MAATTTSTAATTIVAVKVATRIGREDRLGHDDDGDDDDGQEPSSPYFPSLFLFFSLGLGLSVCKCVKESHSIVVRSYLKERTMLNRFRLSPVQTN